MLDSVAPVREAHSGPLSLFEWLFTVIFTVDYGFRLYSARSRAGYALSFFGIVDLLSVIPTYLSLFVPGSEYLATLRFLRIMRIFRVLKLSTYQSELNIMLQALRMSWRRIAVFLCLVLTIVVVLGSFMYTIEGEKYGFTSIPKSIYWAIVTMTTVGYGDISPKTGIGQAIAAMIMILGYSIIVVPTGIVVSASRSGGSDGAEGAVCPGCSARGHSSDAVYCRCCGKKLLDRA
jgi:voltage-gated potassium channel